MYKNNDIYIKCCNCNCTARSKKRNKMQNEIKPQNLLGYVFKNKKTHKFLPRCIECSHGNGIAMGILSVRPSVRLSVRLSNACIVTKRKKAMLDFYVIRKNIYPSFLRRRMVSGGQPLLPEILGQPARVGAKSPILNR